MSRYEIPCRLPHLTCVVGWDPEHATFFAQVFDDGVEHPDEPVVWIGESGYAEVVYADTLARRIAPWADLPDGFADRLEDDRRTEPPRPRNLDVPSRPATPPPVAGGGGPTPPGPHPGTGR